MSLPSPQSNGEPTIELVDPDFEDSNTIRTFLTLFAKADLDFALHPNNLEQTGPYYLWKARVLKLVALLDKYDSGMGFELLRAVGTFPEGLADTGMIEWRLLSAR